MRSTPTQRFVALVAAFALLGAQPAVLCGLACLVEHSPAGGFAHQHHDSTDAPCASSTAVSADGVRVEIRPAGVARPAWIAFDLPAATSREGGRVSPPSFVSRFHPDHPDPPPRA